MLKLALAGIAAVAALAAAAAPAAAAPACRAGGHELATMTDHRYDTNNAKSVPINWTFAVLDTGAWTFTEYTKDGAIKRHADGCLEAAEFSALRDAIAAADWKLAPVANACDYASAGYTEYAVAGKHVWNASPCQAGELGDVSLKAIAALDQVQARLTHAKHTI